jgi:beta-lactam-binding protein with PASTA domain
VVNDQLATAIEKLKAAKLGYTVVDVSSNRPTNTVLKQSPAGGTQTASTTQIVLTVVGTQTSVPVPNVVGDTPAAAGAQLSSSQLTLGTQSNACSTSSEPSGVVTSQTPPAGANVPPQTPVNLVVSSGSCVTVPNVVGDSESEASSTMTGDNLVPQFTNDTSCNNGTAGPGTVDGQTPAANAQVNPNSTVNMTICTPSGTTTTTTTGDGGGTTTTTTQQGLI